MQGQLDSDLTAAGLAQTETNAALLAGAGIESLFCSPLGRARKSAEIINRGLGLPLRVDSRIKEWNCGDWSGHFYEDVRTRWPIEWAAYESDRFNYRGPNAENYPDMIARVTPFLEALLEERARHIAIVSHGLIGRIMVAILLRLDTEETLSFHQPNDVVYRVTMTKSEVSAAYFVAGAGPYAGVVPRV